MKNIKNKEGITLISLIITIIVLLILAGVSINIAFKENGTIKSAEKASNVYKFSTYKEEFDDLVMDEDDEISASGTELKKYITSIKDGDLDKFVIINGELYYCGNNKKEIEAADNIGIDTSLSGSSSIDDLRKILSYLAELKKNNITAPTNDTEQANSQILGIRLYDKNVQNGTNWKLVIDYDSKNNEKYRYGSGYYYLEPKTNLGNAGIIENGYILNYNTIKIIGLENSKMWDVSSTLAVTGDIALNLDATSFDSEDAWKYITKKGDLYYDESNKSLNFDGDGDYLELRKDGLSFADGFTFEMYANLRELEKNNGTEGAEALGLFSKIKDLTKNTTVTNAMRFGYLYTDSESKEKGVIAKFYGKSNGKIIGDGLVYDQYGGFHVLNGLGYNANEDFYLTFVYRRTASVPKNDTVEYYINGNLIGKCEQDKESFEKGRNIWDNDECPFYIGAVPWYKDGNIYYLNGNVYSVRLYQKALTEQEVKDNMNATVKYRKSFINQ